MQTEACHPGRCLVYHYQLQSLPASQGIGRDAAGLQRQMLCDPRSTLRPFTEPSSPQLSIHRQTDQAARRTDKHWCKRVHVYLHSEVPLEQSISGPMPTCRWSRSAAIAAADWCSMTRLIPRSSRGRHCDCSEGKERRKASRWRRCLQEGMKRKVYLSQHSTAQQNLGKLPVNSKASTQAKERHERSRISEPWLRSRKGGATSPEDEWLGEDWIHDGQQGGNGRQHQAGMADSLAVMGPLTQVKEELRVTETR